MIIYIFSIPAGIVAIDFIKFILTGKRVFKPLAARILDFVVVLIFPLLFLISMDAATNDCCNDTATFSPHHKLTIYFWIFGCMFCFFYFGYRSQVAPPLVEIGLNCMLIIGIILNVFIAFQIPTDLGLMFNPPIILLFLIRLIENQNRILTEMAANPYDGPSKVSQLAYRVLSLPVLLKYPTLLLLCLPVVLGVTTFFLLLGQKPDSLIRAFTDTYRQGFSQLNHMCDHVDCSSGGHYLCSVAALGHKKVVRPERYGIRNGRWIVCNRQLLVSNAFEELMQERFPQLHRVVRKNYNKVGGMIHRHYYIFENKFVSDFIYLLMKPLEWMFLGVLYLCDRHPEDRIEMQYLGKEERICLNKVFQERNSH